MELQVQGKPAYAYNGGKTFDATLPTLVFIHGAAHDHSVWALQSRYLAHHGFGVLALDLPGHGRTDSAPMTTIEALADWVLATMASVGIAKAALIGHSMGSLVALEAAARDRDRVTKLVLIGTTFPMKVSAELLAATRDEEPRARDMINIWCHSALAHYPSSPGPGSWVIAGNKRLLERAPIGTLHADFAACNAYTGGTDAAKRVTASTLAILAKRDMMTPIRGGRELAKSIPNARVVEIEGSGHALMAEKPDEVLDALRVFL
ncbi:MAG: alpha/beta hydrolase [Burkholderiales bacterium]